MKKNRELWVRHNLIPYLFCHVSFPSHEKQTLTTIRNHISIAIYM
jgi:hypothetical protein